ncbi:MAG TPA: hypothetical protein VFW75_01275 [Acetobacteraceae bacterium]|nr:hypothetical protein [Acetobacteraceae bacterium]
MIRLSPLLAAAVLTVTLSPVSSSAMSEPALVPVMPSAPANGMTMQANSDPFNVSLSWNTPREPVPVHFFVEVVAIEADGLREILARYVDQSPVAVTLTAGKAEYAWRVYTVGRDIAEYAVSGWERFSVQTK